MNTTVAEIAALVGGTVIGDSSIPITGVNGIRQAGPGDLTFVADSRYISFATSTNASAILVADNIAECRKTLIQVSEPYLAVVAVLRGILSETTRHPTGIHETAVLGDNVRLGAGAALGPHVYVGDDSQIGDGAVIYPNAVIGPDCVIGDYCLIYPNVTIREGVTLGDRCVIHAGAVLGSDGFGFADMDGKHEKIPQVGTVVVGDDVEIGANTAVDRATFGQTAIGDGTKIDNLVQIGHNTRIGKHTVVCGNAGIAGSSVIGDHVIVAAGAGVAGHIEVGDGAVIAAYSGVTKSVKPGQRVFGFPAIEHNRGKRMSASLRQLPEALRTIRDLEARIAQLEERLHDTTEDNS